MSLAIDQPTNVRVTSIRTDVEVVIGNVQVRLNYKDALTIADWIRHKAMESKRFARDTSKTIHIVASLTDAAADLDMHANIREL